VAATATPVCAPRSGRATRTSTHALARRERVARLGLAVRQRRVRGALIDVTQRHGRRRRLGSEGWGYTRERRVFYVLAPRR
jgi:hypothetical protein